MDDPASSPQPFLNSNHAKKLAIALPSPHVHHQSTSDSVDAVTAATSGKRERREIPYPFPHPALPTSTSCSQLNTISPHPSPRPPRSTLNPAAAPYIVFPSPCSAASTSPPEMYKNIRSDSTPELASHMKVGGSGKRRTTRVCEQHTDYESLKARVIVLEQQVHELSLQLVAAKSRSDAQLCEAEADEAVESRLTRRILKLQAMAQHISALEKAAANNEPPSPPTPRRERRLADVTGFDPDLASPVPLVFSPRQQPSQHVFSQPAPSPKAMPLPKPIEIVETINPNPNPNPNPSNLSIATINNDVKLTEMSPSEVVPSNHVVAPSAEQPTKGVVVSPAVAGAAATITLGAAVKLFLAEARSAPLLLATLALVVALGSSAGAW